MNNYELYCVPCMWQNVVIGNSVSVWDSIGVMDCGTVTRSFLSQKSVTFVASRSSAETRYLVTIRRVNGLLNYVRDKIWMQT